MVYGNNFNRNMEELELRLQEAKQMQANLNKVNNPQQQQVQQPVQQTPQIANQQVQGPVQPQITPEQIAQEREILNKFMEVNYGETVETFDKKLAAFKEAWLIEHDPQKVSKSMIDEQLKLLRKSYKKVDKSDEEENTGGKK